MSGFVAYEMQNSLLAKIVTLLAIAIVACFAGKCVRKDSATGIIKYSIGWVVIVFILNILICSRFVDNFFSQWNVWVGYALILLIPLLSCKCCKKTESQQPTQPQQPQ
jgi:cell division protein FtsW (lipid II flippase)